MSMCISTAQARKKCGYGFVCFDGVILLARGARFLSNGNILRYFEV